MESLPGDAQDESTFVGSMRTDKDFDLWHDCSLGQCAVVTFSLMVVLRNQALAAQLLWYPW